MSMHATNGEGRETAGAQPDLDRQPEICLLVLAGACADREGACGCLTGSLRDVSVGGVPDTDDAIANDLGHVTAVLGDDVDERAQVAVERSRQILRPTTLHGRRGNRRK